MKNLYSRVSGHRPTSVIGVANGRPSNQLRISTFGRRTAYFLPLAAALALGVSPSP